MAGFTFDEASVRRIIRSVLQTEKTPVGKDSIVHFTRPVGDEKFRLIRGDYAGTLSGTSGTDGWVIALNNVVSLSSGFNPANFLGTGTFGNVYVKTYDINPISEVGEEPRRIYAVYHYNVDSFSNGTGTGTSVSRTSIDWELLSPDDKRILLRGIPTQIFPASSQFVKLDNIEVLTEDGRGVIEIPPGGSPNEVWVNNTFSQWITNPFGKVTAVYRSQNTIANWKPNELVGTGDSRKAIGNTHNELHRYETGTARITGTVWNTAEESLWIDTGTTGQGWEFVEPRQRYAVGEVFEDTGSILKLTVEGVDNPSTGDTDITLQNGGLSPGPLGAQLWVGKLTSRSYTVGEKVLCIPGEETWSISGTNSNLKWWAVPDQATGSFTAGCHISGTSLLTGEISVTAETLAGTGLFVEETGTCDKLGIDQEVINNLFNLFVADYDFNNIINASILPGCHVFVTTAVGGETTINVNAVSLAGVSLKTSDPDHLTCPSIDLIYDPCHFFIGAIDGETEQGLKLDITSLIDVGVEITDAQEQDQPFGYVVDDVTDCQRLAFRYDDCLFNVTGNVLFFDVSVLVGRDARNVNSGLNWSTVSDCPVIFVNTGCGIQRVGNKVQFFPKDTGTYNSGQHQLVYAECQGDDSVRLFTDSGTGTGADVRMLRVNCDSSAVFTTTSSFVASVQETILGPTVTGTIPVRQIFPVGYKLNEGLLVIWNSNTAQWYNFPDYQRVLAHGTDRFPEVLYEKVQDHDTYSGTLHHQLVYAEPDNNIVGNVRLFTGTGARIVRCTSNSTILTNTSTFAATVQSVLEGPSVTGAITVNQVHPVGYKASDPLIAVWNKASKQWENTPAPQRVLATATDLTPNVLYEKIENQSIFLPGTHQLVYVQEVTTGDDELVRLFTLAGTGTGGGAGTDYKAGCGLLLDGDTFSFDNDIVGCGLRGTGECGFEINPNDFKIGLQITGTSLEVILTICGVDITGTTVALVECP